MFHPFSCRLGHLFKVHAAPQLFLQPVWYGRSKHAEHGNPHSLAFHDGVWRQVRLVSGVVYNVGSEYRAVDLLYPFVVNLVSGFHVMVANGLCVILHVVYGMCSRIWYSRVGIVAVEAGGLSLQNIPVVEQHDVAVGFFPDFLHVVAHPCQ